MEDFTIIDETGSFLTLAEGDGGLSSVYVGDNETGGKVVALDLGAAKRLRDTLDGLIERAEGIFAILAVLCALSQVLGDGVMV